MNRLVEFLLLVLLLLPGKGYTQSFEEPSKFNQFLTPSDTFNSNRLTFVLGAESALYTGAVIALYQYWYKDFETEPFHLFNDNAEWLQQDKAGHIFTAYFETNLTTELYLWTGMEKHKAYWAGFATASIFQLTIEIFDGFSSKWGFSMGDFAANTVGAGLSTAQYFLWDEQRIRLKFSQRFPTYINHDPIVRERAFSLYGTTWPEQLIKDYNGLTTWVSVNPHKFLREDTWWPKWLMVSGGYGAEGLFGGFDNYWCEDGDFKPENCPDELLVDYRHVDRNRQYYLSLDVDFSVIETKSPFWNMMFEVLSIIKVPAPTIEFTQGGKVAFYPFYF